MRSHHADSTAFKIEREGFMRLYNIESWSGYDKQDMST